MYHSPHALESPPSPAFGPLLGAGYVLLWLLLWPAVQPYWMLPYGLRFGALLLTPVRYWAGCWGPNLPPVPASS